MIQYRPAQVDDLKVLASMIVKFTNYIRQITEDPYFEYRPNHKEELFDHLQILINNNDSEIILALEETKLVGFIMGQIMPCYLPISNQERVGYVTSAYTLPEYRDKGIMKCLNEQLNIFFKSKDVKYVELHVMVRNEAAISIWESMGFQIFRVHMRKMID